jgi:hypothetical protein
MLFIDGAKFILWTPAKEEEEFHPIVKEHIKDIFGEQSIFFEASKFISAAGKGSIPDGIVITFGIKPEWHIIEIELSSHQVYVHIVDQVGRFINGIANKNTQTRIVESIYHEVTQSKLRKAELEEKIASSEIYKYLNDLVSNPPTLTIIIEKKTSELEEAIGLLKYSPINIVEFQTFQRIGAEAIHIHSIEPLLYLDKDQIRKVDKQNDFKPIDVETTRKVDFVPKPNISIGSKPHTPKGKITFDKLIDAGFLKELYVFHFRWRHKDYENERAEIVRPNSLKYLSDGNVYTKTGLALKLIKKYNLSKLEHFQGPLYWATDNGKLLEQIENEFRIKRGDRK